MTLPTSGFISLLDIATELGRPGTPITLNDADVRDLLGKPNGAISLADAYGKSAIVPAGFIDWGTPGTYSFTVPLRITSISTVLVSGGGGGGGGTTYPGVDSGPGAGAGSGYLMTGNIAVTPGEVITVVVGAGGIGGIVGTRTIGGPGGNGGPSQLLRTNGLNSSVSGGNGGTGCAGWNVSTSWGSSGRPAALGGAGRYAGNNGGAGNGDINSSYVPGNGGGIGGAPVFATRGGVGLNGFVGAVNVLSRWQGNSWLQGQGAGGGGYLASGSGLNGGAGGGGGGGGLGVTGGTGGGGYVRIGWNGG